MSETYSIVGTNYTGTPESFMMELQPGEPVTLVREPENPADKNAVAVYCKGRKIGYVPKARNLVLSQFIEQQSTVRTMAMDSGESVMIVGIDGRFKRSLNSGFPQVEV